MKVVEVKKIVLFIVRVYVDIKDMQFRIANVRILGMFVCVYFFFN